MSKPIWTASKLIADLLTKFAVLLCKYILPNGQLLSNYHLVGGPVRDVRNTAWGNSFQHYNFVYSMTKGSIKVTP